MGLVLIVIWLVALAVTFTRGVALAGLICGVSTRASSSRSPWWWRWPCP
jgi:hypothetical protein